MLLKEKMTKIVKKKIKSKIKIRYKIKGLFTFYTYENVVFTGIGMIKSN